RVTPVIDTEANLHVTRYEIPDRLRRQIIERDPTCVFPWCSKTAHRADLDHITPYDTGGATTADNLAPLCRHHHRLKTHADWSYTQIEPAVFLWRSPTGTTWLRDRTGTRRT
ncbi:MAG TPA: HNH endonuclease signature motif containing protein, partial [Marmoricola sp.]|nr:HNH endonuclease signature motif containing protein [Marmoricola sp.]